MKNLEKKFGKYAINNLSLILIICYGLGYLIDIVDKSDFIFNFICLNPYYIVRGQIWRIVTWVLIPPEDFSFWTIIMLLFYYSLGRTLEQVWGAFRYNIYIFSGMLFTVLGSFVLMGILYLFPDILGGSYDMGLILNTVGKSYFSTMYVNMSIFLAFASIFPEHRVYLAMLIPVKVKWLGIVYALILIYSVLAGNIFTKVVIIASLLNFLLYFILYQNERKGSPVVRVKQVQRKHDFNQKMRAASSDSITKHKCAICGRTETDNEELQFRFCSKCNGNYEYCNDHIFSHKHVE